MNLASVENCIGRKNQRVDREYDSVICQTKNYRNAFTNTVKFWMRFVLLLLDFILKKSRVLNVATLPYATASYVAARRSRKTLFSSSVPIVTRIHSLQCISVPRYLVTTPPSAMFL